MLMTACYRTLVLFVLKLQLWGEFISPISLSVLPGMQVLSFMGTHLRVVDLADRMWVTMERVGV